MRGARAYPSSHGPMHCPLARLKTAIIAFAQTCTCSCTSNDTLNSLVCSFGAHSRAHVMHTKYCRMDVCLTLLCTHARAQSSTRKKNTDTRLKTITKKTSPHTYLFDEIPFFLFLAYAHGFFRWIIRICLVNIRFSAHKNKGCTISHTCLLEALCTCACTRVCTYVYLSYTHIHTHMLKMFLGANSVLTYKQHL